MKHLSLLLVLALLMMTPCAVAETTYSQSPLLDAAVESGELPPVADRLPAEPKLVHELKKEQLDPEIGRYGGTIKTASTTVNEDLHVFVGMNESLLTMVSVNSDEVVGNILKDYEVNDDCTEFTLYLREGLKWSDGEPVTMEDFIFTFDSFLFNEELTPEFPAKLKAGGKSENAPFTYEVIDDWTLKIKFESGYGGFLVTISISGWVGYTDLLKPSHYLKQFHIDYAEECHGSLEAYYDFIAPFAKIMGYDDPKEDGVWMYVFNQIDMTNWEDTNPNAALTSEYFPGLIDTNFPVLYPFMMEMTNESMTRWVRNPYYFKVDAEGQQLPYVDYVMSAYCETVEVLNMKMLTGEFDYAQADISEYSLLRENEENGGFTVYVAAYHNTPADLLVNINYGLETTGAVKDDPDSAAWQEVVTDKRFRRALMISIDAEELVDTLYNGFAGISPYYTCNYDIEGANALLDEMGMVDIDGDGYRETPSGLTLHWQIWNANEANDIVPMSELLTEYWREIGLHADVYTTDASLLAASQSANEIPMRVFWVHETQLWLAYDWGDIYWAPLWNQWYENGGLTGKLDGNTAFLEPDDDYKAFKRLEESMKTGSPEDAVNIIMPQVAQMMADDMYLIVPMTEVGRLMVVNNDLGNVPQGGLAFAWNMNYEQVYYKSFEYTE